MDQRPKEGDETLYASPEPGLGVSGNGREHGQSRGLSLGLVTYQTEV